MTLELRSTLKHSHDDINISLQTENNLIYKFLIKGSDKVKKLRTKLYENSDIKFKLDLAFQGETLEDGKRIENYVILDGSVIQIVFLNPERILINVHVFKKGIVTLEVEDNITTCDLRQLLGDSKHSLGSAPKVYDFFFESEKLDLDVPLHFYGITNQSRIDLRELEASFKVSLEASHAFKVIAFLEVKGTDHVGEVRRRVIQLVIDEEEEDLKLDNIVIFHNPKNSRQSYNELDCDRFTLNRYGVEPHDYLVYIVYRKGSPCADLHDSHSLRHVHWVSPNESVQSFRLKIQDQLGIPFGKQKLTFPNLKNPSYGDRIVHFEDIKIHVLDKHHSSAEILNKKSSKCRHPDQQTGNY